MEKFIIKQGFKYDFYNEIGDNEVMIANFKSSFLRDSKEIYILRINDERTEYFPVSIIKVPFSTRKIIARKVEDDTSDLIYINCYDEEDKSVCALVYDVFTRENFYSTLFTKFYFKDEDFLEEDTESNLVNIEQLFCNRIIRIAKLNMSSISSYGLDDFGTSAYTSKEEREMARDFLSRSALKPFINYDYYALLDENGCVVRLFSSLKELKKFMIGGYEETRNLPIRTLEYYGNECVSNLKDSERALSMLVDRISSRYGKNQGKGIVLKMYKHFHM